MSIGTLNLMGSGTPMKELLEKQKEQIEELMNPQKLATELEAPAVEMAEAQKEPQGDMVSLSTRAAAQQAGSSMMSRNFAHSGEAADNVSGHLQAQMNGKKAAAKIVQSQQSAMNSMLDSLGVMESERSGTAAGASMAVRRIANKKAGEASERNLDEIKEKLEEKTQEATAPKDANGNPIQVGPEGGELSTPEAEIATGGETDAAQAAQAVAQAAAAAVAPAAPSLNVVV